MPPMYEAIRGYGFGVDTLTMTTTDGSRLIVTPNTLRVEGFNRFTEAAKATWDLAWATLGYRSTTLYLVVPNEALSGNTWIPIAHEHPSRQPGLVHFVLDARELLNRPLPSGEHDD